jgi:hypothetical protein
MSQFRWDRARAVPRRNRGDDRGFWPDSSDVMTCHSSGADKWYRGAKVKMAVCPGVDKRAWRRVAMERRQWRPLGDVYAVWGSGRGETKWNGEGVRQGGMAGDHETHRGGGAQSSDRQLRGQAALEQGVRVHEGGGGSTWAMVCGRLWVVAGESAAGPFWAWPDEQCHF